MGRKPDPTAIHRLRGTFRADRHGGDPEPDLAGVDPPNWLKGDAARERYTEYAAELLPVGLLTRVDVSTLANLCRLEILSETLEDALSVDFVEGSTGQPAADPRWSHFLNLEKQIDQLRRQMGMTPSSRTSVSVERPQEENEVEKWRRAYDG